jgi:DNA-binding transcriptional ArsR family regulator
MNVGRQTSHGDIADIVRAAKAAGHPARIRILAMLRGGPLCACQIMPVLGLAASTVSGHLSELRRAGLIGEDRQGKWIEYRLACGVFVRPVVDALLDATRQDATTRRDASMLRRLRAVSRETLCSVGVVVRMDDGERRVGGRPCAPAATARTRAPRGRPATRACE